MFKLQSNLKHGYYLIVLGEVTETRVVTRWAIIGVTSICASETRVFEKRQYFNHLWLTLHQNNRNIRNFQKYIAFLLYSGLNQ